MSKHTGLCIGLREGKEVFFRAAADVIEEQESRLTAAEKRVEELESKVRACENSVTGFSNMAIEDDARIKKLEGAILNKNHCLYILAKCVADLWHAVAGGMYDARSFVGDTVLPMQETLLEIGIDVREKPLNTEALKG